MDTIRDYAGRSGNHRLLYRSGKFKYFQGNKPMPTTRQQAKMPKPVLSDKERDDASIANVVARFDRPVGIAYLGRFRRRWLEYPPRNPGLGLQEPPGGDPGRDGGGRGAEGRPGARRGHRVRPGARFTEFHREEVGVR